LDIKTKKLNIFIGEGETSVMNLKTTIYAFSQMISINARFSQ